MCRRRFDELHSPVHDQRWGGYVNPTHAEFAGELAQRVARPRATATGT